MIKMLDFIRDGVVQLSSVNKDHKPFTLDMSEIEKIHYVADILKPHRYYERNL